MRGNGNGHTRAPAARPSRYVHLKTAVSDYINSESQSGECDDNQKGDGQIGQSGFSFEWHVGVSVKLKGGIGRCLRFFYSDFASRLRERFQLARRRRALMSRTATYRTADDQTKVNATKLQKRNGCEAGVIGTSRPFIFMLPATTVEIPNPRTVSAAAIMNAARK